MLLIFKNNGEATKKDLERIPFDYCGGCGAGWRHLTISKKGDVMACRRLPKIIGNLFESNFFDILIDSKLLREFRSYEKCGICSSCVFLRFCRGCPAESYMHFGHFFPLEGECEFYIEDTSAKQRNSSKSEWEKLGCVMSSHQFLTAPHNDLIKSWLLMCSNNERENFLSNPEEWLKMHDYVLSDDEIGTLVYQLLNS